MEEACIEHDVAMVAHEKIALLRVEAVDAVKGEAGDAAGDDLLVDAAHDLVLEVIYVGELPHQCAHLFDVLPRIDVLGEEGEMGTVGDALHRCGYLGVVEGTDVVEGHDEE